MGKLFLGATPLGNAADASIRLRTAIENCDIIAAEDTRKARELFRYLDIVPRGKLISFFDHNEKERVDKIIAELHEGAEVLVISDAGMPLINDPGYILVNTCIAEDIPISVLPGPSAVTTALIISGLPTARFCFEGFAPRKSSERRQWLSSLVREERTVVFFESVHRIHSCLHDALDILGADRPAVLCRELTKTYEEVIRLPLGQLLSWVQTHDVKGELTVLFGPPIATKLSVSEAIAHVHELVNSGEKLTRAATHIAHEYSLSKKELYDSYVEWKKSFET